MSTAIRIDSSTYTSHRGRENPLNTAGTKESMYYAAFTRCMILAKRRGFTPAGTGEDHRRLPDHLKDRTRYVGLETAHLLHRVGSTRLVKLKKLRTVADYRPDTEFTRGDAREAIDVFEDIEALLDQVEAEIAGTNG